MQYQGTAIIRVNGREIESLSGATFTTGGFTRQPVKGAKVYGFNQTPTEATINVTIPNGANTSIADLNNMTDVTITFIPDVGMQWLMPNAWANGNASINSEGNISCGFTSAEAKEI